MSRADALAIYEAAVAAADPAAAVRRRLSGEPRVPYALVAAGKAAAGMARAAVEALGPPARGGLVVVPRGVAAAAALVGGGCRVLEADHPVPSEASVAAGGAAIALAAALTPADLLVVLVSGGASALLEVPAPGVSLDQVVRRTLSLLAAGVPIQEVNAARRSLSRIKGGGLARGTKARVLSLVVSDVPGDDPAVVGSGPAVPAPGDPAWRRTVVEVVLTNDAALDGARFEAARRGWNPAILTRTLAGEARDAAAEILAAADEVALTRLPVGPPAALLAGGETTVTLLPPAVRSPGSRRPSPPPPAPVGRGGRCQEFALAAAIRIAGVENLTVLAAGTDGRDGPTEAAGAVVDGATAAAILAAGIDPSDALARHDSHAALSAADATIPARPTGTNVADLHVALVA